jgi:hypothetical protein
MTCWGMHKGQVQWRKAAVSCYLHLTLNVLRHLQTVRDKCFDKCVTKPSSSLSSSEQQCLARCCDRWVARLRREANCSKWRWMHDCGCVQGLVLMADHSHSGPCIQVVVGPRLPASSCLPCAAGTQRPRR